MVDKDEGSKWDLFLNIIAKSTIVKKEAFKFQHEVITINYLYNNNAIRVSCLRWLQSLEDHTLFSDKKSEYYRTKGNKYYKDGCSGQQLSTLYYTYAIITAEENSVHKSFAHANRSLSLMDLDLFEDAYNDCLMAIELGYPRNNIQKIFERQMHCAFELKNKTKILSTMESIKEMNKLTMNTAVSKNKLEEFESRYQKLEFDETEIYKTSRQNKNEFLVEMNSLTKGRFMITKKEINQNEVFLYDEAFAFVPVIDPENKIDYDCQNCARVNVIPFPCPRCCKSTYCSPQCLNLHKNIHVTECKGYILNLWYEIGIAHLSVRTLLCGITSLIEELLKKNIRNENPKKLFDRALEISENDTEFKYGRVLRLVTNIEAMDPNDFIKYSLTASMLTFYLKNYTDFFKNIMTIGNDLLSNENDWEIFVGALIMRHMGQLICNGHVITDLHNNIWCHDISERLRGNKPIIGSLHYYFRNSRVFTGIFPSVSLFNHSCDPNIFYRFNEKKLTVFASRKISKNSEIFNCYGPQFQLLSRVERQNALKDQYSFDCNCVRCMSNDTEYFIFRYYKCQNIKCEEKILYEGNWWQIPNFFPIIKCLKCSTNLNISWYKEFEEITAIADDLPLALNIYDQCKKLLSASHDLKQEIAERILYIFTVVADEVSEIDKLYPIAVELLEMKKAKFGLMSIEYVLASTYLLDILASKKRNNFILNYDLTEIQSSFEILSNQAKFMFNYYINSFVLQSINFNKYKM